MTAETNPDRPRPLPVGLHLAMIALTLAATGAAAYLLWASISDAPVVGCGPASGCDTVLASRWSRLFGIPVAGPALAVYLLLATGLAQLFWRPAIYMQRRWWITLLAFASIAGGAALWFIALQVFALDALCPYCMAAHLCALASAGLILLLAPIRRTDDQHRSPLAVAPPHARLAIAAGFASVAVFALLQWTFPPDTHAVRESDQFVRLDPHSMPSLGDPDAPHSIISIYSYHCPHCRIMHDYLLRAEQQFRGQIVILCMPMNYEGRSTQQARLALAVYRARPDLFRDFDSWLFQPETPRSDEEARERAEQLVGPEPLEDALADPWIDQTIRVAMTLYEKTAHRSLPKLITPKGLIVGRPRDYEGLVSDLRDLLDLSPEKP